MEKGKIMDDKLASLLSTLYDSLTDEQKERVTSCKTLGELSTSLSDEAVTLSDEALEGVSSGYLYYDAPTRMWRIIDDTTGLTKSREAELFEAKDVAQSLGFSDVQISWEQLNRLRKGRAI